MCVCVCCCCYSVAKSCLTLCNPMKCSTSVFSVLHYLPEFVQTHVHWVSDAIQPSVFCCPFAVFLPSNFPSIGVFSNESALHIKWALASTPSLANEYFGLIFCKTDWLGLLAVQGTSKSLLQHHSLKASTLWHSAFFMVQLSHAYMTTGKIMVLNFWTFVGKVVSLLFNMLSRFVIAVLPRSKCLLILWLQSPSAMILKPKKMKCDTVWHFFPSICHEVIGPDAMIFVFWVPKGRGYMYTCGWFMLRFDRKQQNSVKQLSFNKKIN